MIFLRQSTAAQEVRLGKFVDDTDGKTAETGLTIANTDIRVWKAGASSAVAKNSGGATHDANGHYVATLDATDTDTVGSGEIAVDIAGALSVRRAFTVLHANVYDWLFGSTAPSTYAGGAVASVTGAVGSVTGAVGSVTGNVGGNVVGSVGSVTGAVGSVTGDLGGNVNGNVVGSTGSVSGAVGSVTGSVGSVAGDVGGKVIGGGSGTITGDGVRAASVTGAVGSVTGAVGSVTAAVTAGTVSDKTGYSLATAPPTAAENATQVRTELSTELAEVLKIPRSGQTYRHTNQDTAETADVTIGAAS